MAQNHYTVDVIIAWYTVPLLYYFIWNVLPDPKPIQNEESYAEDDNHIDNVEPDLIEIDQQ